MGRTEVQLRISELQVRRYRVMNSPNMTKVEKEDAIWWIQQEIDELMVDLDTFCFRKAG